MHVEFIEADEKGYKGIRLDEYLSLGYFRMLHELFTTNCIPNGTYGKGVMYMPVFWLRTVIKKIVENKSAASIRRKCANFQIFHKPAVITREIEELYSLYHASIDFDANDTCEGRLGQNEECKNPFDSHMVEIRDGDRLIAVGYYDLGKKALMGILNIYHPEYSKYSLGKYLMLQKIDFALANSFDYYYTGYMGTDVTSFDYKVFPDIESVEVFLPIEKEWQPYKQYNKKRLNEYFFEKYVEPMMGFEEK